MSNDVVLSSALRSNLLSLQSTQSNIDKVQNALSTGLKVSSALDNPQSFFAARSLNNRASDLSALLDGIGQSISSIQQADESIESLTRLVEQADSIVDQAAEASSDANIASIAGSTDLSGVDNLASLSGVSVGDTLNINVTNPANSAVTYNVAVQVSTGDGIDELLAKINSSGAPNPGTANGSYNSAGEAVVEASLNADGGLVIRATNGGNLQLDFEAAETNAIADDVVNLAFASSLGFGDVARLVDEAGTATDSAVQVTAVAGGKLTSGAFFSATDVPASASTLLSSVIDSTGDNRFVSSPTAGTDQLQITINDTTTVNIDIDEDATTIQGLVDSINNNATLKNLVRADYDANSGQFSIEKISTDLQTIEIGTNSGGVAGNGFEIDFDFGLTQLAVTTTSRDVSEVFSFGGASGELAQLASDYDKVREQIDQLVGDSAYRGANLLAGEDLETFFNSDRTSSLVSNGRDLTTSGLGLDGADFSSSETIGSARNAVRQALDTIRTYSSSLANDLSIIQAREEFTRETVNNLREGADKLTVADQNEEGAKLLALQTRQQLGVTALSLAAQAQQSVLRLF